MIQIDREDDGHRGRFVIYDEGAFAGEMTFAWVGKGRFIINHTGVDKAFGGKGYGKLLLQKAVDFAREQQVKIQPLCPFAKAQFDQDETIQDVRF